MYILYIKTLKTSSTYLSPMLQKILKPVRFMYICGSFHLLLPATAVIFYDRRTHRFVCFQWRMPWYAMPSSQFLTWSGFVCTCLRIHTYVYLIITRIWLHNIFFFMCDFTGIFIYHIKAVQLLHKWLHSIIPASACQVQVRLDPPHAHGLRSDSTL